MYPTGRSLIRPVPRHKTDSATPNGAASLPRKPGIPGAGETGLGHVCTPSQRVLPPPGSKGPAGREPEGGWPPEPAMCPDRHARPARPAPHVQTAARGPLGSRPRWLGRRGHTARHPSLARRADLRPTPPSGPVDDAVRAPGQAGRLGLPVHQPAAAASRPSLLH